MMERLYRVLLRLLPRDFDRADREEMWQTHRERVERARARGGKVAAVRLRELFDLTANVLAGLWPFPSFDSLRQDLRVGLRALLRAPLVTVLAVASLALGIGATTSLFSALDVWLVRPLPLRHADRLVAVGMANVEAGWSHNAFSVRDYADWSRQTESLTLGIWVSGSMNLVVDQQVERVSTLSVSANLPDVLGIDVVRGRGFAPQDGVPGADPVALVTDRFFRSHLGGDPRSVGTEIVLDGIGHTVIGVMHPDQSLPNQPAGVWRPLRISGTEPRAGHSYQGVAVLDEAIGLEAAREELGAIARRVALDDPASTFPDASVRPFREYIYSDEIRQAGTVIGLAVLFVLLIACANIANVLLARGVSRTHELAVRGALGAGRGRIVQQLLVESLLIAIVGGVVGVGLAFVGLHMLRWYVLGPEVPGWGSMAINGRMLASAATLTVASVLVFGLIPALRASKVDLRGRLAEGAHNVGAGRTGRLASGFVVAEISASLMLLVLSGLMIRAMAELRGVDLGIDLDDAITFRIDVPAASQESSQELVRFYEDLAERLERGPGVTGVAYSSGHFLSQWSTVLYAVPGRTGPDGRARLSAEYRIVSPDYARVLGVEVVAGRWFDPSVDRPDGPGVAVVSRELARLWWASPEDAVGQLIAPRADAELRIVGVVEDTRIRGPGQAAPPAIFEPFAQRSARYAMWMVRHSSDPDRIAGQVRAVVRELDPDLAVFDVLTGEELVGDVLGELRAGLRILAPLGALALVLTLVGVYGVMAHNIGNRMHEMGLRVALGARGGELLRMVLAGSAKTAAVGLGIGVVLSLGIGRGLAWLLAGVSIRDPLVLTTAPLVLLVAILAASAVPAWRAARVDPVRVMRGD